MAQPLTAPYRLTLNITAASLVHKLRTYCEASPSILAASGYYLFDRSGLANIDAAAAAQQLWTAMRPAFFTSVNAPTWLLENRVGPAWNPVASGSLTGAGTGSNAVVAAAQLTISLRTTDFQRSRMILLESNALVTGVKYNSYTDLHGIYPALAEEIAGVTGGATGYHAWARSRNTMELHNTNPIVSATMDLNDKIRRSRHVM